jgi:plastocyanin
LEGSARTRGISTIALAVALAVVIAVAGVAIYVTFAPSGPSTSTSTTTSTTSPTSSSPGASLSITMSPRAPLVTPGQTQNYSSIELQATGSGTVSVSVVAPAGLSLTFNQSSVSLSAGTQSIPVALKADAGLSPRNYTVTVETSSSAFPAEKQNFTIDVVPMLVLMKYPSFFPQNVTVTKGTQVTWINLDSEIGCCDPGEHDVSFLSGGNYTSRLISTFQTVTYTFGTDGVYDYYCTIHPIMMASVTVTG